MSINQWAAKLTGRSREQILRGNATETKYDLPREKEIMGEMLMPLKYLKGFGGSHMENNCPSSLEEGKKCYSGSLPGVRLQLCSLEINAISQRWILQGPRMGGLQRRFSRSFFDMGHLNRERSLPALRSLALKPKAVSLNLLSNKSTQRMGKIAVSFLVAVAGGCLPFFF